MQKVIESMSSDYKIDFPDFKTGDTVVVGVKVIEGERSRIQLFEGVVIAISSGAYSSKTFTKKFLPKHRAIYQIRQSDILI